MAATVTFPNSFYHKKGDGLIIMSTATFKCMLVTSSYVFNKDTHTARSDVTNEITGTGYTAGGVTMTAQTWLVDNTNDRTIFDFDNPTWTGATITAAAAVIYKSTGTAALDWIVCHIDFGGNQSVTAGTFVANINAVGLFVERQGP